MLAVIYINELLSLNTTRVVNIPIWKNMQCANKREERSCCANFVRHIHGSSWSRTNEYSWLQE